MSPTRAIDPHRRVVDVVDPAHLLHPTIATWFRQRHKAFSHAQQLAIPKVVRQESILLSSPTGSGKTLAGFLGVLHYLFEQQSCGLSSGVCAIYVSPLRALTYDIEKNLLNPLSEMDGGDAIRIGRRSGDTTPGERARMKRNPPHILLTTPESLAILLAQEEWVRAFASVRFLVVDEVHALVPNKRGADLMISAERLELLVDAPLCRVGLSATLASLDRVASWLAGEGRGCWIAESDDPRELSVEVFSPLRQNPYPPAGFTGERLMRELAQVVEKHRSVLIFTNTRSGAEGLGLRMKRELPHLSGQIETHHASLDRAIRLDVEDRLKRGHLRCVVCSTSLELGIDIGSIDLVVMVSTPKGVSRALQRIGRSGHAPGSMSRGLLVATNVNDLVECAATARLIRMRAHDSVVPCEEPLDVIAQHIVGLALHQKFSKDDIYRIIKRSWAGRTLTMEMFNRLVRYLKGGGESLEKQYTEHFGKVAEGASGELIPAGRRVARDYVLNIGSIIADQSVRVLHGRRAIGDVEASFVRRLRVGDVFILSARPYRVRSIGVTELRVEPADGRLPSVPRWNAGKMPLSSGVALEVNSLRLQLDSLLISGKRDEAADWLIETYELSRTNAEVILRQFELQQKISLVPVPGMFLLEETVVGHGAVLIFHALIGRSANDALSRVVALRLERIAGGNTVATIDDYGFQLSIEGFQRLSLENWKRCFQPEGFEEDLRNALGESELVRWHFRNVAQTGLLVPRHLPGQERKTRQVQWSADILYQVLRTHEPAHPLLTESLRRAEADFLDMATARAFCEHVQGCRWEKRLLPCISPFAFHIHASGIKEAMLLEDESTAVERICHELYLRAVSDKQPADPLAETLRT